MPDAYSLIRLAAEILISGVLWVILSFIPEAWKNRKQEPRLLPLLVGGGVVIAIVFYYLIVQRWPFSE